MARLPSERFLVQQIGDDVVLFEDGTEREIVRAPAYDGPAMARAQKTIYDLVHQEKIGAEDACFAHFWFGYFYAHATKAPARLEII